MLTTRIAAGATAMVLGISGVALANADLTGEVQTETHTEVSTPAASADLGAETETNATVSVSSPTTAPEASTTSVTSATTSTTAAATSTTVDDRPGTDDGAEVETRAIVSLDLNTYTVGEAGTVTVDGTTLVAVDANPGWTVDVEEASADRIKIEFENGERDAEFELRIEGELRIKIGS